jgi:regulator of protease activity HflC (stomatin/prohibitin superfamily)
MQTYPVLCSGCFCAQCVQTQHVGIVEDLGQFKRILSPGLHFICCPLQSIVGRLSLRIQQLDIICETKTKDNVFVRVQVAVQYRVLQDGAYDAFYRLTDPHSQIKSYVFDVVRYVFYRHVLNLTLCKNTPFNMCSLILYLYTFVEVPSRNYN